MIYITIAVDAPPSAAQGIKEDLAMYLERFGDSKVVSIKAASAQTKMGGF